MTKAVPPLYLLETAAESDSLACSRARFVDYAIFTDLEAAEVVVPDDRF